MSRIIRMPGLIDTHVHLRDPGSTHKEDFFTGTSAALAGGVTTVVDMPNNPNPTTTLSSLTTKERVAREKAVCDYGFYFGLSNKGNWDIFEVIQKRVMGLKVYMNKTTGSLVSDNLKHLEKAFSLWPEKKNILVHAEGGQLEKAILLAKKYNKKVHVCHISLRRELEMIVKAKKSGARVTCEATPHHLFLTSEDGDKLIKGYKTVKPPLASKEDVEYLQKNIKNVDTLGTDHAPHTRSEKMGFHPSYGFPGLETMLPLLLTAVNKKIFSLDEVIRLTNKNPKKIFGLNQNEKTYIEVDLNQEYILTGKNLITKCKWTPFENFKAKGKLVRVFMRGTKVFDRGRVIVPRGFGRNICGNS